MKPFEFVLVIISVIVGLALTEFAVGVTYMIQNYRSAHFYGPHMVMSLFGLVTLLNYWATVYKLRNVPTWTVWHVGIVFFSGLLFFMMTKICFPSSDKFDLNYETYFYENIRIIFVLMILFVISITLEAIIIKGIRKVKKFLINIVYLVVITSGLFIYNKTYISCLTVFMLLMQIGYMVKTKSLIAENKSNQAN